MMVVSTFNACNISTPTGVHNQPNLDTSIHWRQSPSTTSPENNQQNCILNFNNHDQGSSSPVQNGEDNSCYSSENGADNLSPPQETSRSSGSEDLASNLFPISGSSMLQQCMEYSNSDNESSQPGSPSSFHDDDSFRSGKGGSGNGSNGKPKVHKCRSCGFSTTNKHESWFHSAIHMKPEKILRCPECPFVTEYKHHLDFHIWNHQGKKPYKCDKCPYVCVNKSMLKSHLKSHSNVYQYQCANCAYRTKYCHSLKIHLRKYRHEPGMVLDVDGNPNPNPVIDVYGNRRGPKQKSKKGGQCGAENGGRGGGGGGGAALADPHQHIPTSASIPPPLSAFQNFPWVNNVFFPAADGGARIPCPPTLLPNALMGTPPFVAEPPMKPHEMSPSHDSDSHLHSTLRLTNMNSSNGNLFNNNDSGINVDTIKKDSSDEDDEVFQPDTCLDEPSSVSPPPANFFLQFDRRPTSCAVAAAVTTTTVVPDVAEMCLSGSSTTAAVPAMMEEVPLNLSVSHSVTMPSTVTETCNVTTPIVKNRRKGVACKLKRTYTSAEDEEEEPQNLAKAPEKAESSTTPPPVSVSAVSTVEEKSSSEPDTGNELLAKLKNKKNFFYCDFCEITFFNQIMFTMHMGYHGYSDPFTCNRCGKKTEDNIAFYAHMISSAHL